MKKKYMFDNYIINRTQKQHKKERNEKKKNDTEIDMRIISSSLPVCLKLFILDLSLNDLSCDVLFYLKLHQICYCLRFDKKTICKKMMLTVNDNHLIFMTLVGKTNLVTTCFIFLMCQNFDINILVEYCNKIFSLHQILMKKCIDIHEFANRLMK